VNGASAGQEPGRKTTAGRRGRLPVSELCSLVFHIVCTILSLAAFLIVSAGCESHTKSALTDEEVQRLTYAQKPNRPDRLVVSGQTIRFEDVMTSLPEEGANAGFFRERLEKLAREMTQAQFVAEFRPLIEQRLVRKITSVVLSERARQELGDKLDANLDRWADRELRRFTLDEYGGNPAAADEALRQEEMTRSIYKDWKKKQALAQYVVEQRYARNQPITHSEILARYEEMKAEDFVQPGVLQLRLIDIPTPGIAAADPNSARQARALAEELRRRIDAGEDFAALARQYSQGLRKEQGGLWKPRDPEALAAPYDVLARQAQAMQPGQVAGPLESSGHLFIMRLEEKQEQGYRPLSDVQEEVRESILLERRRKVLQEIDEEIARQIAMADINRFVDYCLERLYRQAHEAPAPGPSPAGATAAPASSRGE
jgi:parvulin-like peptidyl-prolyl isomerase